MKRRSISGNLLIVPFSKGLCWLIVSVGVLLVSSCKHELIVIPPPPPVFVPSNNCQNQIIAIKDSLYPPTHDGNAILSVNYINRAIASPFSSFPSLIGSIDPYDHQGVLIGNTYYFLLRNNSGTGSKIHIYDLINQTDSIISNSQVILSYLVYNTATNTFFAKSHYLPIDSLASFQLSTSGSTTTMTNYTNLAPVPGNLISTTIDATSGNIYLLSGAGPYQLNVYNGTALKSIPFAASASSTVIGLRYNQNDSFLYALQDSSVIKIDHTTGSITKVITQPYSLEPTTFGAVMDQCNNQYIISGIKRYSVDSGIFIVCDNFAGKVASYRTASYCYMGLSIK